MAQFKTLPKMKISIHHNIYPDHSVRKALVDKTVASTMENNWLKDANAL